MTSPQRFHKSLQNSIYDGSAHAVMLGIGETYIITYAIALGLNNFVIGLIVSVPILVSSILQVNVLDLTLRISSRRNIVSLLNLVQSAVWAPLFFLPLLFPSYGPLFFLLCLIVYHSTAHIAAPIWNSWMGDLVPSDIRGAYFGRRNKYRALCQLIAFLIAGAILHQVEAVARMWGFAIIFFLAFVARVISTYYCHRVEDVDQSAPQQKDYFSFLTFLKKSPQNNFGHFVWFVFFMLFATNLASPYFTAYMLRSLHFSYLELTLSLTVSLLFQFTSFQSWGYIGDRFGNLKILKITGFGAAVLPLLWFTSHNFYMILVFQVLAGVMWSGFNLAAINYIFDAVTPAKLTRCVSFYNFLGNMGIFLGGFLSGLLSHTEPFLRDLHSRLGLSSPFDFYLFLFLLSGFMRFAVCAALIHRIKEVKKVHPRTTWEVLRHFIGLSLTPEFGSRFINIFLRRKV